MSILKILTQYLVHHICIYFVIFIILVHICYIELISFFRRINTKLAQLSDDSFKKNGLKNQKIPFYLRVNSVI